MGTASTATDCKGTRLAVELFGRARPPLQSRCNARPQGKGSYTLGLSWHAIDRDLWPLGSWNKALGERGPQRRYNVPAGDGRRIEVVANGLPIWQGAQIAVDATIVSPVRRDGQPRRRADHQPGLALDQAVDRKHRAYPELRQARRCRLVVFGVEVGGRVSRSTLTFLRLLARARARQRAPWCAAAARQALNQRWKAQAAFAALRAHACSLLELPIAGPSDPSDDQEVPLSELLAGSLRTDPSRLA